MNTVRKLIATCQARQDQVKQDYSTYTRMLQETEQTLTRATTVSRAPSLGGHNPGGRCFESSLGGPVCFEHFRERIIHPTSTPKLLRIAF